MTVSAARYLASCESNDQTDGVTARDCGSLSARQTSNYPVLLEKFPLRRNKQSIRRDQSGVGALFQPLVH